MWSITRSIRVDSSGSGPMKTRSTLSCCGRRMTIHLNWTEILPHRENVSIEGLEGFRDHTWWSVERANGLGKQLRVANTRNGFDSHIVEFDERCLYGFHGRQRRNTETSALRFIYTSLVTPRSVYDYDMDSRTRELEEALRGAGPDTIRRTTCRSESLRLLPDGVQVPVSLLSTSGGWRVKMDRVRFTSMGMALTGSSPSRRFLRNASACWIAGTSIAIARTHSRLGRSGKAVV